MTTAQTRIVHFIGSLDVGGAETVALDLCRAIPDGEVHQVFVCLSGREGLLAESFRSTGAEVIALSIRDRSFLSKAQQILRHPQADGVVSHVSLASGPLLGLARLCGVRQRVARFHSQADGTGNGAGRRAYRMLMRPLVALQATHILGVTESSIDFGVGRLRPVARRRAETFVLPNGIDTAQFAPARNPLPLPPLVVVHVGRSSPEKNREVLGRILHSLRRTGPSELRVVGSDLVSDLGPDSGELTVVGLSQDVVGQLQEAHVLVLPSKWEGLPTVVLEALSCDIAVVASDLPGIREIARQTLGVTLVSRTATPDTWAAAIWRAAAATGSGAIRKSFASSPFTLEQTSSIWREIWDFPADDASHRTAIQQRDVGAR